MAYSEIEDQVSDTPGATVALIIQYFDRSPIPAYLRFRSLASRDLTPGILQSLSEIKTLPKEILDTLETYAGLSEVSFKIKAEEITRWLAQAQAVLRTSAERAAIIILQALNLSLAPGEDPIDAATSIRNIGFNDLIYNKREDKNISSRIWAAIQKWASDLSEGDKQEVYQNVLTSIQNVLDSYNPKLGDLGHYLGSHIKYTVWNEAKRIRSVVLIEDQVTLGPEDQSTQEAIDYVLFTALNPDARQRLMMTQPEVAAEYEEKAAEWKSYILQTLEKTLQYIALKHNLSVSAVQAIIKYHSEGLDIKTITQKITEEFPGIKLFTQRVSQILSEIRKNLLTELREHLETLAETPRESAEDLKERIKNIQQRYQIVGEAVEIISGPFRGLTGTLAQQVAGTRVVQLDTPLTKEEYVQRVRQDIMGPLASSNIDDLLNNLTEYFTESSLLKLLTDKGVSITQLSDLDLTNPDVAVKLRALAQELVEREVESASLHFDQYEGKYYSDPSGKSKSFLLASKLRALRLPEEEVTLRGQVIMPKEEPKEVEEKKPKALPEKLEVPSEPKPKSLIPKLPRFFRSQLLQKALKEYQPGDLVKIQMNGTQKDGIILRRIWPWQSALQGLVPEETYLVHTDGGETLTVTEDQLS